MNRELHGLHWTYGSEHHRGKLCTSPDIFEGFKKRVKIIVKYFTSIKFDDKLLDSKYRYMSSKHKFGQKFVEAGTLKSLFDND